MSRSKPAPPTSTPWTEAHQREATVRGFELMAERCRAEGFAAAHQMLMSSAVAGDTESRWRKYLARAEFDAARISREVRRVRALAEGRLVRETEWRIRLKGGPTFYPYKTREEANADAIGYGKLARLVRVTRIRRAP